MDSTRDWGRDEKVTEGHKSEKRYDREVRLVRKSIGKREVRVEHEKVRRRRKLSVRKDWKKKR